MRLQARFRVLGALLSALLLFGGCSESPAPAPVSSANRGSHGLDPTRIAHGAEVYRQNCASCHGDRAQAKAGWERPGADGKYPPPPLDGSAHAWHHPMAALKDVIRNGTQRTGGNMPPWRDKLTEADMDAVIAYFQSLWPEPIYAAWVDIDRRARADRQ